MHFQTKASLQREREREYVCVCVCGHTQTRVASLLPVIGCQPSLTKESRISKKKPLLSMHFVWHGNGVPKGVWPTTHKYTNTAMQAARGKDYQPSTQWVERWG